jgi:uncharacterized short protein YbdD (DUF466 family)
VSAGSRCADSAALSVRGATATWRGALAARWRGIRQACRQMFGIPDFDRYLAHMQSHHPDAPLLSERDFHAAAIDRRYGAARPRCC